MTLDSKHIENIVTLFSSEDFSYVTQGINLENSEFPVEDQIWLEALLGDCEIHF